MKLNKILMSVGAALIFTSTASFAVTDPTSGTINFEGKLVNSACGLAASSSPVIVKFDETTTSSLKDGGEHSSQTKNIELVDCDTTLAKHATVTYQPNTINVNDDTLAAILSGTASGAGIGLRDNAGQPVKWGVPSAPVELQDGDFVIPFTAFVKADNASHAVTPGKFTSQINFKIEYQ